MVSLILLYLLFITAGNTFIYQQQHTSYLDAFKKSQQTEIKLLSQLAREALISKNYALIEWFFNTWGTDYQKVVSLTLENTNGFALSQYQRRNKVTGKVITSTKPITLYDGSYKITLITDTSEIDSLMESLKLQLILINIGASLLVVLNIWFIFQRFAMHQLLQQTRLRKIAEDKLKQHEKESK